MEFEDIQPGVYVYPKHMPGVRGECVGTGTVRKESVVVIYWSDMNEDIIYTRSEWNNLKPHIMCFNK